MRHPFVIACLLLLSTAVAHATPTHVNVKDCYPAGQPTNHNAALQKAVKVAQGIEQGINTACGIPTSFAYIGTVYVPPGEFTLDAPLVISKPLTITGVRAAHDVASGGGSRIVASSVTHPDKMIHVMTSQPVLISDITLDADQQPGPNSSAIFVEGHIPPLPLPQVTIEQEVVTIERVTIWGAVTGITLSKASKATIRSTFIKDFKIYGIVVENRAVADRGDSLIEGCWIAGKENYNGIGILQRSSGGLKLIGNKIVNGPTNSMAVGYRLLGSDQPNPSTSVLIIDGNSIEHQTQAAIQLIRGDPDFAFEQVVISNNQMTGQPTGVLIDDNMPAPTSSGWLKNVVITGNIFRAHAQAAISLYEVDGVFIGSNSFYYGVGIYLNQAAPPGQLGPTNVKIGPNAFTQVSAPNIINASLATICPPAICH